MWETGGSGSLGLPTAWIKHLPGPQCPFALMLRGQPGRVGNSFPFPRRLASWREYLDQQGQASIYLMGVPVTKYAVSFEVHISVSWEFGC